MVGMNRHLTKPHDRAVDRGEDDAADEFALEIRPDVDVRLLFRQLARGEVQSERRSQDAAAKRHQLAIAIRAAVDLSKLQHVDALCATVYGAAGDAVVFGRKSDRPAKSRRGSRAHRTGFSASGLGSSAVSPAVASLLPR